MPWQHQAFIVWKQSAVALTGSNVGGLSRQQQRRTLKNAENATPGLEQKGKGLSVTDSGGSQQAGTLKRIAIESKRSTKDEGRMHRGSQKVQWLDRCRDTQQ